MSDPMETVVAEALDIAGINYSRDLGGTNTVGLDFYLIDYDVHIEVKRFHTSRISEQMSRAPNVIALQGIEAVKLFASLIHG